MDERVHQDGRTTVELDGMPLDGEGCNSVRHRNTTGYLHILTFSNDRVRKTRALTSRSFYG